MPAGRIAGRINGSAVCGCRGRGIMLPLGQTMMMMTGAGRGRNWPNLNKLNLGSSSDTNSTFLSSTEQHPHLIPVEYGVYSHIKPNALFIHSPLLFFWSQYWNSGSDYGYTESDDSPGIYLRDDFLGGPTELRAPTAERAALFLDSALAGRLKSSGSTASGSSGCAAPLESALIFTLHVYQYSLSRKGGGKCPTHCCCRALQNLGCWSKFWSSKACKNHKIWQLQCIV